MRDLISRQQAIDAIEAEKIKHGNYLTSSYVGYEMAEKVVKQLPPIQTEPHWIPVTEQPPEVGKSVLICDIDGDIYLGHRTQCGYYYPDFCDDKIKDVRAWCEKPKPYKGVTE